MLKIADLPYLQLESAWAITNIAAGSSEQCQNVVNKGAIPLFVELLKSPYQTVVEQGVWGIANLAGDNIVNRDELISRDVLKILNRLVSQKGLQKGQIMKKGIEAICILCQGKPFPKFSVVKDSLSILCSVIREVQPTK